MTRRPQQLVRSGWAWALAACLSLGLAIMLTPTTEANTPDGETPATEDVCAGEETGKAWGLCNAFCEAMDCDADPAADPVACNRIKALYVANTGNESLPCECPCVETWTNDAGIGNILAHPLPDPRFRDSGSVATCSTAPSSEIYGISTFFTFIGCFERDVDDDLVDPFPTTFTPGEYDACASFLRTVCVAD